MTPAEVAAFLGDEARALGFHRVGLSPTTNYYFRVTAVKIAGL